VHTEKANSDADTRGRIAGLENKGNQHSHVTELLQCCSIAQLQDKATQLSRHFEDLV
jgi:hypothetical protein